jgi:hypothetical protein
MRQCRGGPREHGLGQDTLSDRGEHIALDDVGRHPGVARP